METKENAYQMWVKQICPRIFRLQLVKKDHWKENVVLETISSTIPSTLELIYYYTQTEPTT